MGDSIGMRNERWVLVLDLAAVVLCDGGNGGRLDCASIYCAPVVLVSSVLDGPVNPV